ncbi:hypothetical protein FCM35_KLT16206 [Carex littledalei]|uniref:Uncharacterized protein n=1 Tax=Carex littledalei TaxID=544730 RepID=A0A833R8R9_9POAL|nr:hypothetical protein FCM35_KLT16206 [Carex littledalei]
MASFSPPLSSTLPTSLNRVHFSRRNWLCFLQKRNQSLFLAKSIENGAGNVNSIATEEKRESSPVAVAEKKEEGAKKAESLGLNGTVSTSVKAEVPSFKDERWVGGTWDLKQFQKGGKTDWDAVIDAEVRRRKWLQDNPEASSNNEPVVFDTSIIPWWQWIKRFHLPEAELLNGRAAMIGFFMAYFVDSLTGAGLVDQMGNFFCKTLLFVAVVGVLFVRKNEDIENIKKLIEESTFYDKQWQATWQDENSSDKN